MSHLCMQGFASTNPQVTHGTDLHHLFHESLMGIMILHACARSKVISLVIIVVVVVDTKIAKSGNLGT